MSTNIFIWLLATLFLTAVSLAQAQQTKKIPRVGLIVAGLPSTSEANVDAFRQGLRELSYNEAQNIYIEYRYAEGSNERLTNLAAELVRLQVDVIVTGSTIAVGAAKKLTGTIPIVMVGLGDPVGTGLVASLAHPGGNVTGLSSFSPELGTKRLELLKEAFPRALRIAIFINGANPSNVVSLKEIEVVAPVLGVQLQPIDVRSGDDFESAFAAANRRRAAALLVQRDPLNQAHRTRIVAQVTKRKWPAMYPGVEYVTANGLMSYGVSSTDLYRRAARYVDKVLKGTKPQDLPVEQPMKFEFVVNLSAAKQIGVTIPPNLLVRANRVIR